MTITIRLLPTELTHLFFCACKFHCFADGNKRIAISLCAQMLLLNGYLRSVGGFIRESENVSYHVAAGNISKSFSVNGCRLFCMEMMMMRF